MLAGAAWVATRLERVGSILWVKKAPGSKTPMWGGFSPELLSYEVCRKMHHVLTRDNGYPYCDDTAGEELTVLREDKAFFKGSAPKYEPPLRVRIRRRTRDFDRSGGRRILLLLKKWEKGK